MNLKNLVFLFISTFIININFAQEVTYHLIKPPLPNPQIKVEIMGTNDKIGFHDFDQDNDLDIILVSANSAPLIYVNDGNGNLTKHESNDFSDFNDSKDFAVGDFDNDGKEDIIIVGSGGSNQPKTLLYRNAGNNSFTKISNTPFQNYANGYNGFIAFFDKDNDNDLDVIFTAYNNNNRITQLFENDGFYFTEVQNHGIASSSHGSIGIADIDNDNDLDLFISGVNDAQQKLSSLYENNGSGTFTLKTGSNIDRVNNSTSSFADIDGDNDLDLFITGENLVNEKVAKFYSNDGNGNFTVKSNPNVIGVSTGDSKFKDLNNDNKIDLIVTGTSTPATAPSETRIYQNDGNGNYSQIFNNQIFERSQTIDVGDVNGDNQLDLIIGTTPTSLLYINNLNEFLIPQYSYLEGKHKVGSAVGDLNGDNFDDLLIMGSTKSNDYETILYISNGDKTFSPQSTNIEDLADGKIILGDIDNDDDLDVLIMGFSRTLNKAFTGVYKNDGAGNFSIVNISGLTQLFNGDGAWLDVDNDTDLDFIICGEKILHLYENDGTGGFTKNTALANLQIENANISTGDIDGDDDIDIAITGKLSNLKVTKIYKNDGTGAFIDYSPSSVTGVEGLCEMIDIDNDNDLDLVVMGEKATNQFISEVHFNNGIGVFTKGIDNPFGAFQSGLSTYYALKNANISSGDVDNDGDVDFMFVGITPSDIPIAKIILNNGSGIFVDASAANIKPLSEVSQFIELDNDGDLDLVIFGENNLGVLETLVYDNITGDVSKVNNLYFDNNLLIYPNPVVSLLKFELVESHENISATIYDVNGQKVLSKVFTSTHKGDINIENLPHGIYVISFSYDTQSNTISKRFVK